MLYTLHPESFTPRKFNEAEPENPAFQQHSPFPGFDLQLKHVKLQWCKHLTPATSHQTGSRKQKQEEAGDTQLAGVVSYWSFVSLKLDLFILKPVG